MASHGTQGGSHEQHVKAGQQSHKNTPGKQANEAKQASAPDDKRAQSGAHAQQTKAGQQSHKTTASKH